MRRVRQREVPSARAGMQLVALEADDMFMGASRWANKAHGSPRALYASRGISAMV